MKKTILQNVTYLFISNFAVRLLTALATILVARYLGTEQYGILSIGLAFGAVAGYFTDLGLTHTLIREGTKPEADIGRLLGGALKLRLLFAAGTTIVSVIMVYWLYRDPVLRNAVYYIVIPTIWGGALQGVGVAYFQMIEEMNYVAAIRIFSGVVTAGFLLLGVVLKWPLYLLAIGYGMSSLIGGIVSTGLVLHRMPTIGGFHSGLLDNLMAFTLGGLLVMLLPQMSLLVLQRVTSLREVGYFSAAYRIPSLLYQIPGTIAAAFYPRLFHLGAINPSKHIELSGRELKFMSVVSGAIALPFVFYPDIVIKVLFGDDWVKGGSPVLAILAWVVVFQGINYPLADALSTRGFQSRRTGVLIIATALGVLSYMTLGSKLGAIGGAIAALIVEGILFLGYTIFNSQGLQILKNGLPTAIIALFLTTVSTIMLKYLSINTWVGIVWAPISYIILVVIIDPEVKTEIQRVYIALSEKLATIRKRDI
ncbi:MAG: hypothetical protein PWQ70_3218 [Clostridiales bacterium]|nr:hypothetical protein [Clostridiales bacterium]